MLNKPATCLCTLVRLGEGLGKPWAWLLFLSFCLHLIIVSASPRHLEMWRELLQHVRIFQSQADKIATLFNQKLINTSTCAHSVSLSLTATLASTPRNPQPVWLLSSCNLPLACFAACLHRLLPCLHPCPLHLPRHLLAIAASRWWLWLGWFVPWCTYA